MGSPSFIVQADLRASISSSLLSPASDDNLDPCPLLMCCLPQVSLRMALLKCLTVAPNAMYFNEFHVLRRQLIQPGVLAHSDTSLSFISCSGR
jgi:hypothetical protein